MKFTLFKPSGTDTVVGNFTIAGSNQVVKTRATNRPPGPAGPVRVTVPVTELPDTIVGDASASVLITAALIVKLAVTFVEVPNEFAAMTALVSACTGTVATEKVKVVCPAAIFRDEGILAATFELETTRFTPAAGAGEVIVTVTKDVDPPVTELGVSVTPETVGLDACKALLTFRLITLLSRGENLLLACLILVPPTCQKGVMANSAAQVIRADIA